MVPALFRDANIVAIPDELIAGTAIDSYSIFPNRPAPARLMFPIGCF